MKNVRWYETWMRDGRVFEIVSYRKGIFVLVIDGFTICEGTKAECDYEADYFGIYEMV